MCCILREMPRKLKNIISLVALVLLFTACSKEAVVGNDAELFEKALKTGSTTTDSGSNGGTAVDTASLPGSGSADDDEIITSEGISDDDDDESDDDSSTKRSLDN